MHKVPPTTGTQLSDRARWRGGTHGLDSWRYTELRLRTASISHRGIRRVNPAWKRIVKIEYLSYSIVLRGSYCLRSTCLDELMLVIALCWFAIAVRAPVFKLLMRSNAGHTHNPHKPNGVPAYLICARRCVKLYRKQFARSAALLLVLTGLLYSFISLSSLI